MARTTASQVKAVLGADYDSVDEPSLTPFIDTASLLVDDLADAATTSPSAVRLEMVERWLSAHFYAMSDQPYGEEWVGKAKATFQGNRGDETIGKYLEASKYGQQAILLDSSGYLIGIATGQQRITAGFSWLGKVPSEQISVWDRD